MAKKTSKPDTAGIPANEQRKVDAIERRMHHEACDEMIEDAIALLALLEICGEVEREDFSVHKTSVEAAARTIVTVLRKAQEHHHKAL